MKLATRILIFTLCLLTEVIASYIFVKYAVASASKLWMICFIAIMSSFLTQIGVTVGY